MIWVLDYANTKGRRLITVSRDISARAKELLEADQATPPADGRVIIVPKSIMRRAVMMGGSQNKINELAYIVIGLLHNQFLITTDEAAGLMAALPDDPDPPDPPA